jgi:hypothetical protein
VTIHYLDPGQKVTVQLVADSSGNVASRGDLVEIAGETGAHTQVSVVETEGAGVALLKRMPREYDSSASYAGGDVVGETTVLLRHAVDFVPVSGSYSPSAGDQVVSDVGGGIRAVDRDGTAPDDTADMILGRVWSTNTRGKEYVAGKAAVIRT